jgi:carbon-monoxide dehydrogenase iron sulfur subunit
MLTIDIEKCSGCSRCEVHCSFFHSGKVGRQGSRIKVVKMEDIGIDFPVVCRLCQERYCTKCPESAISIGSHGQVVVSGSLCTACGICETLCPIGAIEMFEEMPYVCDLCGGDPRCLESCTLGAISFESDQAGKTSLKAFKKGGGGLTPENKRCRFAQASSSELRDKWTAERRG